MRHRCCECGKTAAQTFPAVQHVDGTIDRTCKRCWLTRYFVEDTEQTPPAQCWLLTLPEEG